MNLLLNVLSINRKSEIRNPKSERSPHPETGARSITPRRPVVRAPLPACPQAVVRTSAFGFLLVFGLRLSDFKFRGSSRDVGCHRVLSLTLLACCTFGTTAAEKRAGFVPLFPEDGPPKGWVVRAWDDV